jgi:hypothetical protein
MARIKSTLSGMAKKPKKEEKKRTYIISKDEIDKKSAKIKTKKKYDEDSLFYYADKIIFRLIDVDGNKIQDIIREYKSDICINKDKIGKKTRLREISDDTWVEIVDMNPVESKEFMYIVKKVA